MSSRTNRSSHKPDIEVNRQAQAMQNQADSKKQRSTLRELNELEREDIEDEIGLEDIDIDSEDLNAIAVDDADNSKESADNASSNNVDDKIDNESSNELDDEIVSDLPQEMTQSYGTGLQGQPTDRSGRRAHLNQARYFNEANATLTGGDIDANYEQANAVGDESVGGTVATPDQDIVDDLGTAVGLEVDDRTFLRTNETLEERDDRRWELDPKSSEDYQERRN